MTNKEAIKYLKQLHRLDEQRIEAISMAINALTHSVTKTIDKEEPISEDLEEYAKKLAEKANWDEGMPIGLSIELVKAGANWQRNLDAEKQIMKKSIAFWTSCIEDCLARRMEIWHPEMKQKTIENFYKYMEKTYNHQGGINHD